MAEMDRGNHNVKYSCAPPVVWFSKRSVSPFGLA